MGKHAGQEFRQFLILSQILSYIYIIFFIIFFFLVLDMLFLQQVVKYIYICIAIATGVNTEILILPLFQQ